MVEPVAQILTLTPICTHNMRFSSYVLSPDHTLTVSFERNGRKPIFLFVDESRAFLCIPTILSRSAEAGI